MEASLGGVPSRDVYCVRVCLLWQANNTTILDDEALLPSYMLDWL